MWIFMETRAYLNTGNRSTIYEQLENIDFVSSISAPEGLSIAKEQEVGFSQEGNVGVLLCRVLCTSQF